MPATARFWIPAAKQPTLNMQSLWQLAVWGISAGFALGLAVAAGYSETGSRRLMLAMNGSTGEAPTLAHGIQAATRSRDAAIEAPPLAETVRVLVDERDRLAARVGRLERHLDDLTGAIKAQTGTADLSAAATHASPQATAGPVATPASGSTQQATGASSADATRQSDAPIGARSETAPGSAGAAFERPLSADVAKVDFGVDIGGAANFEGLRQLWASTSGSNAALFEGLFPVVALRENGRTRAAELRMIVGPLADAEAATRLCEALAAAHRYCQPASFEGQRLSDAEKASERGPVAQPRATPKASTPPRRLFGLF
jgi:hypothetical protein